MEIKCQLDATEVFIADLTACSTCFGHHYAHHQELKSIIQWLLPVVFRAVVFQVAGLVWNWGLCVRFAGCCSILQTTRVHVHTCTCQAIWITLLSCPFRIWFDSHALLCQQYTGVHCYSICVTKVLRRRTFFTFELFLKWLFVDREG